MISKKSLRLTGSNQPETQGQTFTRYHSASCSRMRSSDSPCLRTSNHLPVTEADRPDLLNRCMHTSGCSIGCSETSSPVFHHCLSPAGSSLQISSQTTLSHQHIYTEIKSSIIGKRCQAFSSTSTMPRQGHKNKRCSIYKKKCPYPRCSQQSTNHPFFRILPCLKPHQFPKFCHHKADG